jgi:hypothetical protein
MIREVSVLAASAAYILGRLLIPAGLGFLAYWLIGQGIRRNASGEGGAAFIVGGGLLGLIVLVEVVTLIPEL